MDGKLQAILSDETALAKIAAIVKGTSSPAIPSAASVPSAPPVSEQVSAPVASNAADDRLVLLSALRPFLKESRRARLDSITKVIGVAKVWQNTKHI